MGQFKIVAIALLYVSSLGFYSRPLYEWSMHSSYRLFHGRGGLTAGLEHVVVDSFDTTLLITLYKETTLESLKDFLELPYDNILIQKRFLTRPEMEVFKGQLPESPQALEMGCLYNLKFGASQNIGFFLDMQNGRKWLMENANGKRVLNLFSYTCSLSVAALKGLAEMVVNIDMAKGALSTGKENHKLNGIEAHRVKFLSYDIMKSWNNISKNGPYDLVIIDPPTNQGDSFNVERDYAKVLRRMNGMTSREAEMMICLNSPHLSYDFLHTLIQEHAPEFEVTGTILSAFSQFEKFPEKGLKILICKKNK